MGCQLDNWLSIYLNIWLYHLFGLFACFSRSLACLIAWLLDCLLVFSLACLFFSLACFVFLLFVLLCFACSVGRFDCSVGPLVCLAISRWLGWPVGQSIRCSVRLLVGWSLSCLVGWVVWWLFGWLVGQLAGCFIGYSVARLFGQSVRRFVAQFVVSRNYISIRSKCLP